MKRSRFILGVLLITGLLPSAALGAEAPPPTAETADEAESTGTLGRFLERFSAEHGIEIYLDERLRDRPVNIRTVQTESAEAILRRVTAPYSRAYAYTGPSKSESRLAGIWVFEGEDPADVDFVVSTGTAGTPAGSAETRPGGTALPAEAGDTARTIKGKDLLKRGVRLTRSPLGTPVPEPRARRRRPDYRPSGAAMRQARSEAVRRRQIEAFRRQQVRRRYLLQKQTAEIQRIRRQEADGEHQFLQKRPDF
jgi:hypothetical protein